MPDFDGLKHLLLCPLRQLPTFGHSSLQACRGSTFVNLNHSITQHLLILLIRKKVASAPLFLSSVLSGESCANGR